MRNWCTVFALVITATGNTLRAQDSVVTGTSVPVRTLLPADIAAWKNITYASASPKARWFGYVYADDRLRGEVVFRRIADGHTLRLSTERSPAGPIGFSADELWGLVHDAGDSSRRTMLLNLAGGAETTFFDVSEARFSGVAADYLLVYGSSGSELYMHPLKNGPAVRLPSVTDFLTDSLGRWLFYTAVGSGGDPARLVWRDLATQIEVVLDTASGGYAQLTWENGSGGQLSLLRTGAPGGAGQTHSTFLWFTAFGGRSPPARQALQPESHASWPQEMVISDRRSHWFAADRSAIYFAVEPAGANRSTDVVLTSGDRNDSGNDTLRIWHPLTEQTPAPVPSSSGRDADTSFLMLYRIRERALLRLEDSVARTIVIAPRDRWGLVASPAHYDAVLDSDGAARRNFDVVDLRTGAKVDALVDARGWGVPSPDGQRFLFQADGHYFVYEFANGRSRNITENVPVTLVVNDTATYPELREADPAVWSADSRSILVSDGWDLWHVPITGVRPVNVTVNGRTDSIRYGPVLFNERRELGVDLRQSVLVRAWGPYSKREGIARIDVSRPGAAMWLWDDARFLMHRVSDADAYFYTYQTATTFPDYHLSNSLMAPGVRITDGAEQHRTLVWSGGAVQISYKSASGTELRGALYLPAFGEGGGNFPTIVQIDGALDDGLHTFTAPSEVELLNIASYTSRGLAVFRPEIATVVNEPGRATLESVMPAIAAAVEKGLIDTTRMIVIGEGWGGHGVLHLLTHSGIFRGGVAISPYSNLVSAFGPEQWGGIATPSSLLRESDLRLSGSYWENRDSWVSNSPIFHAARAASPLLLLHHNAGSRPALSQSVEMYRRLRNLGREVVLLEYPDVSSSSDMEREHSVDRARRISEFADMLLRGVSPPRWWIDGTPR